VRATEDAVREHQGQSNGTAPAATASETVATPPGRKLRPPGLVELEELLGDQLETRVTISMGAARGKVVVEFSTLEDLERIYRRITDGTST
jgi:ParB family chromosome partitioning protein